MYGRLRDSLLRYRRPESQIERDYPRWRARRPAGPASASGPIISVIMPAYRTPPDVLLAAITSVRNQTYRNWELCAAHDASANMQVLGVQAALDRRIKTVRQLQDGSIAAASNDALALATGEFVCFLDHDDELAPDALARMAAEAAAWPDADMIFSDEDQLEGTTYCRPYFKPGWNPDLLLAQNAVCHLAMYRRSLVQKLGGLRRAYDGSQDYDLALRASRIARRVRHVPDILYSWGQSDEAFSTRMPDLCAERGRLAVAAVLPTGAVVEALEAWPAWNRVIYPVPEPAPRLSLILPPESAAPVDEAYPGLVEQVADPHAATGDILVFLAPGLQASAPGWLLELVGHALRPEIGAVGARLDAVDGRIRHAGYYLDAARVAQTLHPGSDTDDPGYRGQFVLARTVSAVSRLAMAVRRDVFLRSGGFDAACGSLADVDFCLGLGRLGLRCVWTPHARLILPPGPDKAPDKKAIALMKERWGAVLAHDPYGNPNLQIVSGNFVLVDPAAVARPKGF